ncbi:unnamed protein product [Strongylus vulgaris]|uniref:Nucleoporin Nup54 alpha-helical domain-containing protein n=1 Tax=Strongylus vulgaris TaxID=40348 RepID=A0A3P7IY02_STRVU|nr:unnamed protein product [Strongylus vulgaris]
MKTRIHRLEANVTAAAVQLAQQKVIQQRLSHRLLRVLSMQMMSQRFTQGIDATEENGTLRSSLSKETGFIDEADALNLKKYLDRCQDGLESLVAVLNSNLEDIQLMAAAVDA